MRMQHKENIVKKKYVKTLLNIIIVCMMILVSITIIFIKTAVAEDPSPNEIIVSPSEQHVTVKDTFSTNIYANVNWEINNVSITNITFEPSGLLNYTATTMGNLFSGGTIMWLTPENPIPFPGGIYNESGYANPIIWITNTGVNNTNGQIANITWYANDVGEVFINLTGSTYNNSDTNYTTNIQNGTVIVHPQNPQSFTAETVNDAVINLSFIKGYGADNTTIIYRTDHYPANIGDGIPLCNISNNFFLHENLASDTTYYYMASSWNNTFGLPSLQTSLTQNATEIYNITITGRVRDRLTLFPLTTNSGTTIIINPIDYQGGGEGPIESMEFTNDTGYFSEDVTEKGEGRYELMVMRDGYVGYINGSLNLQYGDVVFLDILLDEEFDEANYSHIRGNVTSDGQPVTNAQIILLDTDFTHMWDSPDMPMTYSNSAGIYNLNITYRSSFILIAYYSGYYSIISSLIDINNPNQTQWYDFILEEAPPDTLTMTINYCDLDDAIVTVNRTIIAASPLLRFGLDFDPMVGGNANQQVSETEVTTYLLGVAQSGPTLNVSSDQFGKGGGDDEGEPGSPDFLSTPVSITIDGSNFDSYIPGSYSGDLDNIINTSTNDNSTIYYNATFNITLDGSILNQTDHVLGVATNFNTTLLSNINFDFSNLYNIFSIVDNSTNVSITNTSETLLIIPGSGSTTELAYANFTLNLNASTVSLPIIEAPSFYIKDKWNFVETTGVGDEEVSYRVEGRALRNKDYGQYTLGDNNATYLCYILTKNNFSGSEKNYVTVNDIDWLVYSEEDLSYLINDLSFPLYNGKTWYPISWWGQLVNATVYSCNNLKTTENGTYLCVQINYTNATDHTDIVGHEWYSPDVKFFVNRTQYINSQIVDTKNLINFTHGPYIETYTIYENDSDSDGLINSLDLNIIINASKYYEGPTNFMIEGPFYKEGGGQGPMEDITWVWEEDDLRNLGTEIKTITMAYSGSLINSSGVDGPYTGWLELRESGGWGPGQTLDYVSFTTKEYSHLQFESPAITLTNIEIYDNDTNSDGKIDYLTINTTLNVITTGNYEIHGGLDYVINHGFWDEWQWITGTGADLGTLTQGTNPTVYLNFQGSEIYEKGYTGTYKLHLELVDKNTNTRIIENQSTAGIYSYTQFATPSVYFNKTKMAETGNDYINGTAYFTVNASINVEDGIFNGGSGTYELCGGIHYPAQGSNNWGEWITGNCNNQVILYEGENLVPLNFNIGEIQEKNNSYVGNFTVHMDFHEKIGNWFGPTIDNVEYTTANYNVSSDFPAAPIALVVISDEITNDGDTLKVNAIVTINADEYSNTTYELHGGVHYKQNVGGNEWWYFITGTGGEMVYLNFGQNDISLNFSGQEISNSGQNGPYPIWMGLSNIIDHSMVTSDDNYEADHNASDFSSPDVQFDIQNTSSALNGTEYLTVNIQLLVNTAGQYHIGGGVHRIIRNSNWNEDIFITGMGQDLGYLSAGTHNISLNFEQSIIKNGLPIDYSDILKFHIGVENSITWQQIAHLTYDTPQSYTRNDFSSSGVSILGASASISNNNLIVNISYNVTNSDTYIIHGGLNTLSWSFVTGTYGQYSLQSGEHCVEVIYNGKDIFNSMQNGPYKAWLGIENTSTNRLLANIEFTTNSYSYNQFAGAASGIRIIRENMTAGSCDFLNSSGSENYLTVSILINVSSGAVGNYWLDGGVNYVENNNWYWITGQGNQISLSAGENNVSLNFRQGDIYSSLKNGPYKIWIGIRNMTTWTDEDHYDYTTQAYIYLQMSTPPIQFGTMNVGECDYLNSSEYITINVTLNVSSGYAGTYNLHGGIHYIDNMGGWCHITHSGDWVTLLEGNNTIPLNFNAGEVQNKLPYGYNDELKVWIGLNNGTTWNEVCNKEYTTQQYSKSGLPGPKITLSACGDYVNDTYLTINLTVNVTSSQYAGIYDVHGGIHYIDTSSGFEEWKFLTGTGSQMSLQTGEHIVPLNFNAGDIYTKLSEVGYNGKLTVWAGIQNITTWQQVASAEYWTTNFYSSSSFNPPSLQINCTGDHRNDTDESGKYLTINTTINATGSSLNQAYQLSAGLHYRSGWEWRFITGTGNYIDNITNNITIPINFAGSAIRASEQDGPYEVWVGINIPGQWQPIVHDEYTTNIYSYTEFSEPDIRIIQDSLTDYANDTGGDSSAEYLTINVTINASSEALGQTYFLEGGLHWKVGYQWNWMTWAVDAITITSTGEYDIPLNFDAKEIANAANNGWTGQQLVAWIALRNSSSGEESSRVNEYQLQNSYTSDQFTAIPVTFNGIISDSGGSDTPFTFLNVTVPINGTSGNYIIFAALYDPINNTLITTANNNITQSELDNGSVIVSFNGTKIFNRQYSGIFEFRAKLYENLFLCDSMVNTTSYYNYTDFVVGISEARIIGNYSNYTNVNDDLIINVTINVNLTGAQYELYGDLFDNSGLIYITNAKNTTTIGQSGDIIFQLTFNNSQIQNSSVSEPYKLAYLRLSIYRENIWDEINVKIDPYINIYPPGDA